MKFLSRSVDKKGTDSQARAPVPYQSVITTQSVVMPGVVFVINRISFGRRMELSRLVREITRKAEFLEAGTDLRERIEAGILSDEVDRERISAELTNGVLRLSLPKAERAKTRRIEIKSS